MTVFSYRGKIMHKYVITALLFIITTPPAMAGHAGLSAAVHNAWGGILRWTLCKPNDFHACIGSAYVNADCDPKAANKKVASGLGGYKDNYPMLLMLARKVNVNGAYFCPTQFQTYGPATTFAEPSGNNTCIWLCRKGYTGEECKTKAENFTGACDAIPFLRENYDNTTVNANWSNIEWNFWYFQAEGYTVCTGEAGIPASEEHDNILAISKFLPSGNGAFARQMTFRTHRYIDTKKGTEYGISYVYPTELSKDILVCKQGYQPNISETDCEPINPTECTMTIVTANMCRGWDTTKYDETIHVYKMENGCYRYQCKQPGYALTSNIDHSCTECITDVRAGINPVDKTCVKCNISQVFNPEDAVNGYCSRAIGLTQTDLIYGQGKSKGNYKSTDLKKQCWTISSPTEYKNCVLNIISEAEPGADSE